MRYLSEPATDYDVAKQKMIYGADVEERFGFPKVDPISAVPKDVVDFETSLSRSLKGHHDLAVHFYISDSKFERIWNCPSKYIDHLKCFQYVIMPDFTLATGVKRGFPFALNVYNKYRNHALAYYFKSNGIKVIPSLSLLDPSAYDWMLDGLPVGGTFACTTNGRLHNKLAKEEFLESYEYMESKLKPSRMIIIGREIKDLKTDAEVLYYKSRGQKYDGNSNR